jgi:hypothetical protein
VSVTVRFAGGGRGTAVDLDREATPDPETVAAAVRDPDDDRVDCPTPRRVHEYVGVVDGDTAVPLRAALAAAARSRGERAPRDRRLAEVERRRAALDVDDPEADLAAARERVAEAGADEAELREEVARLRGVAGERDDPGVRERLREAARRLSEAETERIAAEEALERARVAARAARDARERRLELADRADNLRRAARDHLAEAVYSSFAAACRVVPGEAAPGDAPGEYSGDGVTAALAVARVAAIDAPVVLACRRFVDAEAARDTIEAPVIRL